MRDPNVARGYIYGSDQSKPFEPDPKPARPFLYLLLTVLFLSTIYIIGV